MQQQITCSVEANRHLYVLEGEGAAGGVPGSGQETGEKKLFNKHLRFIQEQYLRFAPCC